MQFYSFNPKSYVMQQQKFYLLRKIFFGCIVKKHINQN